MTCLTCNAFETTVLLALLPLVVIVTFECEEVEDIWFSWLNIPVVTTFCFATTAFWK